MAKRRNLVNQRLTVNDLNTIENVELKKKTVVYMTIIATVAVLAAGYVAHKCAEKQTCIGGRRKQT